MADEVKYFVKVLDANDPLKVSRELISELKGVVSGKMISRMKREYIHCPVVAKDLPFLVCFACESHMRRVKGEVHCAGLKGPNLD